MKAVYPCKYNKDSNIEATINDCDICEKTFEFPGIYCCLEMCGELEACVGCTHGIFSEKYIKAVNKLKGE